MPGSFRSFEDFFLYIEDLTSTEISFYQLVLLFFKPVQLVDGAAPFRY